jgi:tyrosinase
MQSIVPGISMPYWDATDEESLAHGVPDILTRETYTLDGKIIKNPLRSYVLPVAVSGAFDVDNAGGPDYSKPKGKLLVMIVRYSLAMVRVTYRAYAYRV